MADIDTRQSGVIPTIQAANADDPIGILRSFISQASGIPLNLVRKRWQQQPGTRPSLSTNWCSVAITGITTDGTPLIRGKRGIVSSPKSGYAETIAHQVLTVSVEFYGESAQLYADGFRDSCSLTQNASALARNGLQIRSVDSDIRRFPDFAFEQWCDRYEVIFRVGRKTVRRYGVRDYAALTSITLHTEKE